MIPKVMITWSVWWSYLLAVSEICALIYLLKIVCAYMALYVHTLINLFPSKHGSINIKVHISGIMQWSIELLFPQDVLKRGSRVMSQILNKHIDDMNDNDHQFNTLRTNSYKNIPMWYDRSWFSHLNYKGRLTNNLILEFKLGVS